MVEALSCIDAIEKYVHADGLMFLYPCPGARGYEDAVRRFKGGYIILVGEIETEGHTNPRRVTGTDMGRFRRGYARGHAPLQR